MPNLTDKKSILEALRNHPEQVRKLWVEQGFERHFEECIHEAKSRGIQFRILPKDRFVGKQGGIKSHVFLERDEYSYIDPDSFLSSINASSFPFICALDGVQDPQNLGNIIRSAACFNVDAIIIPKDRACAVTSTVVQIARGAVEHVKVARVTNLARYIDSLKQAGIFCCGFDEKGKEPLWTTNFTGATCLVFGGEEGLRRLTREMCDTIVSIPTNASFLSLNVATSFAIASYELTKQRKMKGLQEVL